MVIGDRCLRNSMGISFNNAPLRFIRYFSIPPDLFFKYGFTPKEEV